MNKIKEKIKEKKESVKILYEDKDILAVYKPAGFLVHSDGKNKEKTLVNWFLERYPKSKNVGEDIILENGEKIKRSGIVHRLDKETSGVMLLAKTKVGFEDLKKQFQEHTIKKIYQAFVWGILKDKRGLIEKPIGRDINDFRKKTVSRDMKGEIRDAITTYIVMKENKNFSFIKAIPKTGRTHQIRVHMASLGHPIVADKLYSNNIKNILGFKRTALHSRSIEFKNIKGESIKIEAVFPEDFLVALDKIGYVAENKK